MKKLLIILTLSTLFFAGCTSTKQLRAKDNIISAKQAELADKSEQLRICRDLKAEAEKSVQTSVDSEAKPTPTPTPKVVTKIAKKKVYVTVPNPKTKKLEDLEGQVRSKDKLLLERNKTIADLLRKIIELKKSCS